MDKFELSDFQKESIKELNLGKNILLCVPTGTGKTLIAEVAIQKAAKENKRVIYTAPIKALSNQKYYDFRKKFPDITFGIVTGDIKKDPNATCILMTTEILQNKLFNKNSISTTFDVDMSTVKYVVFDEIHYINDPERGPVWENCIIYLKKYPNIQLIGLSATVGNPEKFRNWITSTTGKDTYLYYTDKRHVPLKIYMGIFGVPKNLPDHIQKNIEEPLMVKNDQLIIKNFEKLERMKLSLGELNNVFTVKEAVRFVKEKEWLPCLYFCFSRKKVEEYANYIETSFLDTYSQAIVSKECKNFMMTLPNYKEYTGLEEYTVLVKLAEKGVSYHHSGMIPVFKELVELLFGRGFIKILFVTETFSVGINMPTKAVIFDSFKKFDGNNHRFLRAHEYTQMAGRAGRRGIDTIGYVVLTNKCLVNRETFKEIICGTAENIESKYKMNLEYALRYIESGENPILSSFSYSEKELKDTLDKIEKLKTTYTKKSVGTSCSKKPKNKRKMLLFDPIDSQIEMLEESLNKMSVSYYADILKKEGFVIDGKLTSKGVVASFIKQANPFSVADFFDQTCIDNIDDLICALNVFQEPIEKDEIPRSFNEIIIQKLYLKYEDESDLNFNQESLIREWIAADDVNNCMIVLSKVECVGDFVKMILHTINLANELISGYELLDQTDKNVKLLNMLSKVKEPLMKFVVTNQSLYI